ncbi:hypothetical protein QWY75_10375 [Pontixanthobacter aestiaquae]|uniref:Uncharacterized protein n=1 Tax=Pontixanthobacter aestiaquae TaxID=1509367 RepID=A0A844Z4Z1_9SPHN|nr:hypothetical protein [Pontixanthobacter aestiaquae]MDN3646603.1 hypothetical protein [Pontixanthobacter aestiaquae]MXO82412.1 hypothetical protein [Pontixanthobacter aestiaquae]
MIRAIALVSVAAMLAGCTGGAPRMSQDRIKRALVGAPGVAQPSKVVAAELALARAVQEDGQWTAFRAFAAPGAIIHSRKGPVLASTWLAGLKDPVEAVRRSPDTVWMSCDSTIAVSEGRFREPDSVVGSFVTVWQRQPDRAYLWIYDVAVRDDPQPAPKAQEEPIGEDEILVTAMESIRGLVADCQRPGFERTDAKPAPPALTIPEGTRNAVTISRDSTLRWRWEHPETGQRRFVAEYLTSGRWQVALNQPLGAVSTD